MTSRRALGFALLLLPVLCLPVQASEYSQPGFYDVEDFVLDNGLRVVLKPRHAARNVAIQLVVNVGELYFPCGKRETAHFLEHLLFTGTDRHTEIELDELIESNGGSWNATTAYDNTIFTIDIFSRNVDLGLETLHEIITRSEISQDNVDKSRRIIFREAGGRPSAFREWLYKREIIQSALTLAVNQIFPGIQYQCLELDNASSITRAEVVKAYHDYYVAGNMSLVLVGDFDPAAIKPVLARTFGTMPAIPVDGLKRPPLPGPLRAAGGVVEGRLHPLLGSEASIYLLYRTDGLYSRHSYALSVLEDYFQTELFNRIRVEHGMAYAPSAERYSHADYGALVLQSDADLDDVAQNIELVKTTVAKFQQGNLDPQRLEAVKRKILLNEARGYESNNSFADYYAGNLEDLVRYGKYENFEDKLEQVSMADIQAAAKAYLRDDNLVVAVVRPTFTYTQFYMFLLATVAMAVVLAWRVVRRLRKRRSPG